MDEKITTAQEGGPAFPSTTDARGGMSLRDYFAARAMQGFVSSYPRGDTPDLHSVIACEAYAMAEAMLKARVYVQLEDTLRD